MSNELIFKDWMTSTEIASLKLKDMPTTSQAINYRAKKHSWNSTSNARIRKGSKGGGGYEYHIDLLPEAAYTDLTARRDKATVLKTIETKKQEIGAVANPHEVKQRKDKYRAVGKAREMVLRELELYCLEKRVTQRQAILSFVDDFKKETQARASGVIGQHMDDILYSTIGWANDRGRGLTRSTLYNWIKAEKEGGAHALVPKPPKKLEVQPDWLPDFLKFYLRPQKPSMKRAYEGFKAHLLDTEQKIPSLHQIRAQLGKMNILEKSQGREGPQTLKAKMAFNVRSTENLLPTCVYSADGKTFDAEIAHPDTGKPYKPEITTIIDVATRKFVSFKISDKENMISVALALRFACKEHGIPAIFYVDNGSGYKNKAFDAEITGYMARIGIMKSHALPYNSQAKGIIERAHKTPLENVAKELPSYLGKDMDKEASHKFHKQTRKDIREFGTSSLLPTFEECRARIAAEYDRYNNTPHRGLPRYKNGQGNWQHYSPNEMWQKEVEKGFEPILLTDFEADDAFRIYEERKVNRCMIQLNNNSYFHMDLSPYHGEVVLVGQDFDDANVVYVREKEYVKVWDKTIPGRLICKAVFEGNKTDYFPKSYVQKSHDERLEGQRRRAEDKLRIIEEHAHPARYLTAEASEVVDFASIANKDAEGIEITPPSPAIEEAKITSIEPPKKKRPRNEADLAAIVLEEGLDALLPSQRELLVEALNNNLKCEVLQMQGVDVEAVKNAFRQVA